MSTIAIDLLTSSKLASGKQLEMMGGDLDLTDFFIQMRDKAGINLITAITDANIDRTIEGASTLVVDVQDDNMRTIQKSGRLGRKVEVNVDGLSWTLVGVKKAGRDLTLTFEETEVNVCRYYDSFKYATRAQMTRARFIYGMLQEVKEVHFQLGVNVFIPEIDVVQQVSDVGPGEFLIGQNGQPLVQNLPQAQAELRREQGIHFGTDLTVKGFPATAEEIDNANIILAVGKQMNAPVKVMIASINTAITESTIHNLPGGDLDSKGVFQQRASQGWPASGDVATDAAGFFKQAISVNAANPNLTIAMLCQNTQHSGTADGSNYSPWTTEAEQFVVAYGTQVPKSTENAVAQAQQDAATIATGQTSTTASGEYFVRGTITKKHGYSILKKEDTWSCAVRLGNEVNWRMFCVSGSMYYMSEKWLFQSKPFMRICEDSSGIDWIDYDYDEGKRQATITITAHLSRWSAPPGSTIAIFDSGIVDGKWLVRDVQRSIFNSIGTITLTKPNPVLPEPTTLQTIPAGLPGALKTKPPVAGNSGTQTEVPTKGLTPTQKTVIAYVTSQLGVPYQWGAETAGVAFDCSGLTQAAYNSAGIYLTHSAQDQYDKGPILPAAAALQPADLVFFGSNTQTGVDHVGVYIGNGAMIDAPHTGAVVRVDKDFLNWTTDPNFHFLGATRPWQQ